MAFATSWPARPQSGTSPSKTVNSDHLGVTCTTSWRLTDIVCLSLCVFVLVFCWFFLGTMVNPGGSSQPPAVGTGSLSWKRCAGCGGKIADRFLLYTMDSYWHSRCLKCSCCQAQLGEIGTSCYTKSGMILCRNDYIRWGFVMRAYILRRLHKVISLLMLRPSWIVHFTSYMFLLFFLEKGKKIVFLRWLLKSPGIHKEGIY